MISIVLYGRNDNYGYNLHKRAALSLNCIAEVLTDRSDEILFVDYNTPDDFPTFPEAIQDTITPRAKEMLRIFRVRPHIHNRFKSKTRLLALEPIARNVAIRRSSKANRWILSTNTDMIFVPLRGASLSSIVRGLAPGFYHAPRLEIPEVLWESLDRSDPADVIRSVRAWGSNLHLNEIVLGSKLILYDGPGDFQLLLRSDLFENDGFDEEMLLGWHVDANIAARMRLKYGQVGDLGSAVYGYHCDHTRQVTPAHSHSRTQNDARRFVTEIAQPDIPEQASSWGCVTDEIEEIRLPKRPDTIYVRALREAIGKPLHVPNVVEYAGATYNNVDYEPRHVLPFLTDIFVPMPRLTNLAWYCVRPQMLALFARVWLTLGFTGKILLDRPTLASNAAIDTISLVAESEALAAANVFVFDFGGAQPAAEHPDALEQVIRALRRSFRRTVRAERERLSSGASLRRIIALNAINNEYEHLVCGSVAAAATPFSTHMRHGFVLPSVEAEESWLAQLGIGEAGVRVDNEIRNVPSKLGWIAYGPHKYLDEGTYEVSLQIELLDQGVQTRPKTEPCLFIEARAGAALLAVHLVRRDDLVSTNHSFEFAVGPETAEGPDGVETRIAVLAPVAIAVRDLGVKRAAGSVGPDHSNDAVLRVDDWLPFLRLGELGRLNERGVAAQTGPANFVVYGPYWPLPDGKYELIIRIEHDGVRTTKNGSATADVLADHQFLVAASFNLMSLPYDDGEGGSVLRLPFEINSSFLKTCEIETRIWTSGEVRFTVHSLSVRRLEERQKIDLMPFMLIGNSGEYANGEIHNRDRGRIGLLAYSPTFWLEPRAYSLKGSAAARASHGPAEQPCAILIVKDRFDILEVLTIRTSGNGSKEFEVEFEVPSQSEQTAQIKVLLELFEPADVKLSALTMEPAPAVPRPRADAPILRIENWLPFLHTKPNAHREGDGIVVREGEPGYVIHGPYWRLPPGDYELICSVTPLATCPDGGPFVGIDVSAEAGRRRFGAHQWQVGHIQLSDPAKALDLRLPFSISVDVPAALRVIETRIFRVGNGSFRMRWLTVKSRSPKSEWDWFPYLAIGECGIHTGHQINSVAEQLGYIASSPRMPVEIGRYTLAAEVLGGADEAQVGLEIWSESDLIAVGASKTGRPFEFDVTEDTAQRGIELRLRAISAGIVSIRSVAVAKTSSSIAPSPMPAVLRLDDWLPFLQLKPLAHREKNEIVVEDGEPGYAIYGPYWTLPPGEYELAASVVPSAPNLDGRPVITMDVSTEAGQRRLAEHQWHMGRFQLSKLAHSAELRLPFQLAADLPPALRTIETRIFTSGGGTFRVRSLAVRRIADLTA